MKPIVTSTANVIFNHRIFILILLITITAFLAFQTTSIKLDASFTKNIPQNHSYMETYLKHRENFGGANSILISVCNNQGDIFTSEFFNTLKNVHDQLFFISGIERTQVKSLFSSSTRFVEVVEDGFVGGPVIPASFTETSQDLMIVKTNIEKAGVVGRLVSNDYSCAMVTAMLMDFHPNSGEAIDALSMAKKFEVDIREQFQTDNLSIHIIGFSKMVGDVADGAKSVVLFFAIAIVITAIMVFLFCRSLMLTILPVFCSLIAVVWQLGVLSFLGFGLDPMSILIPFLVFAIGVSHGVQMINAIIKNIKNGLSTQQAVFLSFTALLIPGLVALLTDTIGFLTLLSIDIGIIQELAIAASLGVAMIIFTNLLLLPMLVSFLASPISHVATNTVKNQKSQEKLRDRCLILSIIATPKVANIVLFLTAILFMFAFYFSINLKVGELHEGAPALYENSRYNLDSKLITNKYAVTVDYLTVITETVADACTYHEHLSRIEQFQWRVENVEGVESAVSLASVAKTLNAGFNEGNLKWHTLPRNQQSLVQAISKVPTSSGLLNNNCSVMPVVLFLVDHKADTIHHVVENIKKTAADLNTVNMTFTLASGPVGIMAATNETIASARTPMMLYVYGAVTLLCLVSFNCFRSTISVVLPLFVVSIFAQWLMTILNIGLTVYTLPIIALGVGIGVDYGIYILSMMNQKLKNGLAIQDAYRETLQERGSAVLITGLTLAIGVSTWIFSDLKFQADMGILLTFMFLVNMLAAVIILPALAFFLWRNVNTRGC
jgi:predicted RND superfamily exporter protein